jgi:hypothetical protein
MLPKKRDNREAKFRRRLLSVHDKKNLVLRRIENAANSGMFDLVYCCGGEVGFIELKSTTNIIVDVTTLLKPSQRSFAIEFSDAPLYMLVEHTVATRLYKLKFEAGRLHADHLVVDTNLLHYLNLYKTIPHKKELT